MSVRSHGHKYWLRKSLKNRPLNRFIQPWTACMIMMVEGNLFALTLAHAETAAKTGVLAAVGATVAQLIPIQFRYKEVYLIGLFTILSDYVIHPSHFGGQFGEAIATGFGAAFLAFVWERVVYKSMKVI